MENTAVEPKALRISINPSYIAKGFIWFLFGIGLFIKCTYFQFSTRLNTKPYFTSYNFNMFLSLFTSVLVLAAIVLLLFNRKRFIALFIVDLLMSVLLLSDILYFRYYYNAITVPVLMQIGLAGSVKDSILSLFRNSDLIFAADIPLFIAGLILVRKLSGRNPAKIRPLKRVIASAVMLCVGFMVFQAAYAQSTPSIFPYDNNCVINDLGIFYFHYYDVRNAVVDRFLTNHKLNAEEKKELDSFFSAKEASETSGKYTGLAKGKNLIVIQLEAMQQFLIHKKYNDREVMPNLNKFIDDSAYFDNFYYQVGTGNTSDAEFLTNNSLYPLKDGSVYFKYPSNTFESLPRLLKKQGYNSYVFHANNPSFWNRTEMYKAVGFDRFFCNNDFIQDDTLGWGLSDKSFFRQSFDKIDTSKPFYSFLITLSSHHPFVYFDNYPGFDVGVLEHTMAGNYLKAANYVDQALGQLLEDLKRKGLYDNSVIVIYGDHHAVLKDETDMLTDLLHFNFSEYNWTKIQKTPCFIRIPGMTEKGVNHTICGEVDMLPTLANLFGVKAPHALGKDIFNTKKGYAVLRNGSVVTDEFTYVSTDRLAYDNNGLLLDKSKYDAVIQKYQKDLEISDIILQKNALKSYQN